MKTVTRIAVILIASGGILFLTSPAFTANCNKNPDHPQCGGGEPPPPPPDGSACVNSAGVFPAFAYKKTIVTGQKRREIVTSEIYLTNSIGDCSILIFSADHDLGDVEYVQRNDGEGRIIWDQQFEEGAGRKDPVFPTIRLVTFHVTNGAIDTLLPLADSTIYTHPMESSVGINDKTFSPDGDRVYFAVEQLHNESIWLNSLNVVDIENCTSNCPADERFLEFPDEGVGNIAVSPAEDRIYFSSHDRIPDVYRVSFTQMDQSGSWSKPTDIVTSVDMGYENLSFRELDADNWPVLPDPSFVGEIVAVHFEEFGTQTGIKVFHTDDCVVDTSRNQSCIGKALSSVIREFEIPAIPIFTSIPLSAALPPSLLVQTLTETGSFDVDLESLAMVEVLSELNEYLFNPAD